MRAMDTVNTDTGHISRSESEAERQARMALEAARIGEAEASIAAGYFATSAEVKAWIDSIGTDHRLPVPYPSQSRPL